MISDVTSRGGLENLLSALVAMKTLSPRCKQVQASMLYLRAAKPTASLSLLKAR